MWRLTFAFLALFCLCSGTSADSSISATTGNTVSIWCKSPDKTSVFWQYQREITGSDVFLSTGGPIAEAYRSRIGLDSLSNGQFILTIHNLTTNDSGIYVCSEEAGFGAKYYTRIFVKEHHTYSSESATVGSTVQLQCRTTVQIRVVWVRQRRETNVEESLTTETHVPTRYASKFALAAVSHGDYALTIRNVQLEDSGLYSCVEAGRSQHTVNLTVFYPDVNECSSNPCANGGSCVDGVNKYSCVCPNGFSGSDCEKDIINECSSNPCVNDGICVDLIHKYVCACLPGSSGTHCENTVENVETSTKKMDHTGLSGSAVGLVVSLVFILVIVVIFLVLMSVWCWKNRRSRHRNSKKSKKEELLKGGNNNEYGNVLSETLNFVSGITLVNNRLFVLRCRALDVYRTSVEPHVLIRQLQVPTLIAHPRNDMTSCAKHQSLYISDYMNSRVLKLELDKNGEIVELIDETTIEGKRTKVIFWSLDDYGRPSGVTVTEHHTLLVSCFESRILVQLTTEGKLHNKMEASLVGIESHLYDPMQAFEVNNVFVVCHGGDGIWLVDQDGRITKTLDSAGFLADVPTYAQLAWPCNMAVGSNGQIYVADHYNDRVVELDSELHYVREVVTRLRKIFRPRRLFYDNERKMLYVGVLNGDVYGVDVKADGGGDINRLRGLSQVYM